MLYLFIDTETDSPIPQSAEVVQLAYVLTMEDGFILEAASFLVRTKRAIPEGAYNVHGISNKVADTHGVGMKTLFGLINRLFSLKQPIKIIAHNAKYDTAILLRLLALEAELNLPHREAFKEALQNPICTMLISTPICKLPNKRGYKWPKLSEVYQFFIGKSLEGAHNALWDTLACREIFFKMQELGYLKEVPKETPPEECPF